MGVSIFIPKIKRKAKDCPIDEELLRRLWDPDRMDQYLPFKSKPLTPVPKSYIEYFKNGQSLGVAFKDLNLGKYHPAISAYGGASVSVNFGYVFHIIVVWRCRLLTLPNAHLGLISFSSHKTNLNPFVKSAISRLGRNLFWSTR